MALAYRRLSEEEDKMRNLFEKGEYAFSIKKIEEKPCKDPANQMLVLDIEVMNDSGRVLKVRDWVMLTIENMEWKLRHLCATTGLLDKYEAGTLNAQDFLNKHGVAKLVIDEYEKDGEAVKTNRVADYVKPKAGASSKPANGGFIDDDIPL